MVIRVPEATVRVEENLLRDIARALTYDARLLVIREMKAELRALAPDAQSEVVEAIVALAIERASRERPQGSVSAEVSCS